MSTVKLGNGVWLGSSLPIGTGRVFLTLALAPGDQPEPPIDNRSFLESFLNYGVWIRVVAAHHLVGRVAADISDLERMSLVAAFYQLAGAAVEDALATWIAWSVWSLDKNQPLPDLLKKLQLRSSRTEKAEPGYFAAMRKKLAESHKAVHINPAIYLQDLIAGAKPTALPSIFGIDWKSHASRKGFESDAHYAAWAQLPQSIAGTISPLVRDRRNLLSTAYNKIKHGPQATVVTDIAQSAHRRGFSDASQASTFTGPHLRILLDGSRTQESDDEAREHERVAPFLLNDVENMRRFLYRIMLHNANMLRSMGTFMFNSTYPESKRTYGVKAPVLMELLMGQAREINRPTDLDAR